MEKTNKSLSEELASLMMQMNAGKSPRNFYQQVNRLLSSIGPHDIANAENHLMKTGLSARRVHQLSAAFLLAGILEGNKTDLRKRLPEGHLLRKIIAEHEMIRCFLADLEEVNGRIHKMNSLGDTSSEFMRLSHIAEHINALEEHLDRENDVIFPYLKQHGWDTLCRSVENDHVYLQLSINDMVKLISTFRSTPLAVFKKRLNSLVSYFCPALREHLFHEDYILFPLAVEMTHDKTIWDKLKKICDEIDYCGIHL